MLLNIRLGEVPSSWGDCIAEYSVTMPPCVDNSDFPLHARDFRLRNGNQSKAELVISASGSICPGADFETSVTPYDFDLCNGGRALHYAKYKFEIN